jgi:predicted transcriptional regulator
MKSVLISIQPKWCEKICSGKKTIEVRKTRPKIETPFKCYIYMTKNGSFNDFETDKNKLSIAQFLRNQGKVIGEFVCDRIEDITYNEVLVDGTLYKSYYYLQHGSKSLKKTCLTIQEIKEYLNGKYGFGWHISDLKIYDKPKELSEFYNLKGEPIKRAFQSWGYINV